MDAHKPSLRHWLAAGSLGLALLGVFYLTARHQPSILSETRSPLLSPLAQATSPLVVATSAPPPVNVEVPSPAPTSTSWPTSPPAPMSSQSPNLTLTVLHTNDTWGYLRPCG